MRSYGLHRTKRRQFDNWPDAFDFVRECGYPKQVEMIAPAFDPGIYKLYPSGIAEKPLPLKIRRALRWMKAWSWEAVRVWRAEG